MSTNIELVFVNTEIDKKEEDGCGDDESEDAQQIFCCNSTLADDVKQQLCDK